MTFTFDVDVGASAADTAVANRATITYDGATVTELRGLTFSTPAASIAVVPTADLSVTKVNDPATIVAGGTLTSTLTVRNDGPSPATEVVVTDELPAGLGARHRRAPRAPSPPSSCVRRSPRSPQGRRRRSPCRAPSRRAPRRHRSPTSPGSRVRPPIPNPTTTRQGRRRPSSRNADLAVTKSASPADRHTRWRGAPTRSRRPTTDRRRRHRSRSTTRSPVRGWHSSRPPPPRPGTCTAAATRRRCTLPSLAPGASVVMTVAALALPSATPGAVVSNSAAAVQSATPDADPTTTRHRPR